MYFKGAVLLYLCFSTFWNTPELNFNLQSYFTSVNSSPILMWFGPKQQKSPAEIEYEIRNKELDRREQEINRREKHIDRREKHIDQLNRQAGEAGAWKSVALIVVGILVMVLIGMFTIFKGPFVKGSSLSDDRHNSDKANQLISWVSENLWPRLSNKYESKKLPQGDDVEES